MWKCVHNPLMGYYDHVTRRHPHESVEHFAQDPCYRSKIILVSYVVIFVLKHEGRT